MCLLDRGISVEGSINASPLICKQNYGCTSQSISISRPCGTLDIKRLHCDLHHEHWRVFEAPQLTLAVSEKISGGVKTFVSEMPPLTFFGGKKGDAS